MLIRDAEVAGRRVDLRCTGGQIAAIATGLAPTRDEPVIDAAGGALLAGLHDHHLHLFSLAAALVSVDCGPPAVRNATALARALAEAPRSDGWRRGVAYHESVAGPLDRIRLDALAPDGPVRIQHRSGIAWHLNSAALAALGLDGPLAEPDRDGDLPRIERDAAGHATGRLFRADAWLRRRLPMAAAPDLGAAASRLARFGITGFTDATPTNDLAQAERFRAAQRDGSLPQRVVLMGDASLAALEPDARLSVGARKFLLDEPALPDLDALVDAIRVAHDQGRGAAFHCVTRVEIQFALAALATTGTNGRDRIEHASVAPPEAIDRARRLGARVVTQPAFVLERGDDYLRDVEPRDRPHLYRLRSWLEAGVPLAAGTDAPYGQPDPWRALAAATRRRTRAGRPLGPNEAIEPETALGLFSSDRATPCDPLALRVGMPADLCLLDRPWRAARDAPSADSVAATLCAGRVVHARNDAPGARVPA
ncbi:MAG: amidohydrolase family protein [Myxococcota bacterium]